MTKIKQFIHKICQLNRSHSGKRKFVSYGYEFFLCYLLSFNTWPSVIFY